MKINLYREVDGQKEWLVSFDLVYAGNTYVYKNNIRPVFNVDERLALNFSGFNLATTFATELGLVLRATPDNKDS